VYSAFPAGYAPYTNLANILRPRSKLNNTPGIKILLALPFLFIGIMVLIEQPWDVQSIEELYIQRHTVGSKGEVEELELWRGCQLKIQFENPERKYLSFEENTASFSISPGCEVVNQIKISDYFQKFPSSNKCLIVRKDSVMLFDCAREMEFIIQHNQIPISELNGWGLKEEFKWIKMSSHPDIKQLEKLLRRNGIK